jgi:hypothetical protein
MNFNRPVGTDSFWTRLPAVETAGYFQMRLWREKQAARWLQKEH